MPYVLKNPTIHIQIDLPKENYQFSRFDWTGKIAEVKFEGVPVSTHEREDKADQNLLGRGFYNEFGIDGALGFEEAEMGDWFHKIGIGLLKKEGAPYQFNKGYEIRPANFTSVKEANRAFFTCESEHHNGYAYRLKKEIVLLKNGFGINYSLKNLGEKQIQTEEYVHNFVAINHERVGKNYLLSFPFQVSPDSFEEEVNPKNIVQIGKNELTFKGRTEEQFFFSRISGREDVEANWTLSSIKNGIGIRERGSFRTTKINVWGWGHVICPELFFKIAIEPGETAKWSRDYEVFRIHK